MILEIKTEFAYAKIEFDLFFLLAICDVLILNLYIIHKFQGKTRLLGWNVNLLKVQSYCVIIFVLLTKVFVRSLREAYNRTLLCVYGLHRIKSLCSL